jgi:mRNA interferase MazF
MDGLIDIPEESWLRGGTPDESRVVPWGVRSIGHEDIDFWQGRLVDGIVDTGITALVDELR